MDDESKLNKLNKLIEKVRAAQAAANPEDRRIISLRTKEPYVHVATDDEEDTDEPKPPTIDEAAVETLNMAMDMVRSGGVRGAVVILGLQLSEKDPDLVTDATSLIGIDRIEDDITVFLGGIEQAKIDLVGLMNDMVFDFDEEE